MGFPRMTHPFSKTACMNRRPLIVAAGEALWDMFPDGPRFGGAPANFACHAAALGADVVLLTRLGPG